MSKIQTLTSVLYDDFYPFFGLLDDRKDIDNKLITISNPDDLRHDTVLLIWGGGDISPALYNQKVSKYGGGSPEPDRRDRIEWACLQRAIELGVTIIGICRGAQMLCAAAGGSLIQHLDGHAGRNHTVKTYDGKTLVVNSLHHQMMFPFEVDHKMIAWSEEKRSSWYDHAMEIQPIIPVEPELVLFPKIKGIAAQWHPEMMHSDAPATDYLFNTINEFIEA